MPSKEEQRYKDLKQQYRAAESKLYAAYVALDNDNGTTIVEKAETVTKCRKEVARLTREVLQAGEPLRIAMQNDVDLCELYGVNRNSAPMGKQ